MIDDRQPWRVLEVDATDPVDRQHPLNRGRTAWWLAVPPLDGGARLYDLFGLCPATLTAMGNSSNGWRGSTRPGALGASILCDGTAGWVAPGQNTGRFVTASDGTLAAWVLPTGTSPAVANAWLGRGLVSDFNGFLGLTRGTIGGLDRIWAFTWDGAEKKVGATYTVGQWIRAVWVHAGGTLSLYMNGVLASSIAAGNTSNVANVLQVGRSFNAATGFWSGLIEDATTWNRGLTAAEVQQDYDLSRLGYPGVLNRVNAQLGYGRTAYAVGTLAATAGPATVAMTGVSAAAPPSAGILTATAGPATVAMTGLVRLAADFRASLVLRLEQCAALATIVGTRIYPEHLPETAALPALVYSVVSAVRVHSLQGASGVVTFRVQFSAFARTLSACAAIVEALRQNLDGLLGVPLSGAVRVLFAMADTSEVDSYDEPDDASDVGTHQISVDYLFKVRETVPTLT